MKFKSFIVGVLLALLIMHLISCSGLTKQQRQERRDSKLIEKIKGRSPGLFAELSDTTVIEDSINLSTGAKMDTAAFRENLLKYWELEQAKKDIHQGDLNIEQKGAAYRTVFDAQQKVFRGLIQGGYEPFNHTFSGTGYSFNISFNPKSSLQFLIKGKVTTKTINNKTTITIKEFIYMKPTMWQAVKKLWPYLLVGFLSLVGIILKFILK